MHSAPAVWAMPCEQERHWHDQSVGKLSLEIGFVQCDILDTSSGDVAVHIDDPIHEKERIAVRQQGEDVIGFHPLETRLCAVRVRQRSKHMMMLIGSSLHEASMKLVGLGDAASCG
jgi:hypothetical protein